MHRSRGGISFQIHHTQEPLTIIARRITATAMVGSVPVGSAHPIVVQSMTNTDTADASGTALQVAELARAGSRLVRVTVNNDDAARAVPEIASRLADMGVAVPVIGDFHYNGHLLLVKYPETAKTLAKYRINPGNVGGKRRDENFRTIIKVALDNDKPVRIGVNWGSLDQDLLTEMMDENACAATPGWLLMPAPIRLTLAAVSSTRQCSPRSRHSPSMVFVISGRSSSGTENVTSASPTNAADFMSSRYVLVP